MNGSLGGWLRRHGVEAPFSMLADLYGDAVVFVVDADRNILFWNDAAERILGFSRVEVLGAHCLKGVRCPRCITGCGVAEHGAVIDVPVDCHDKLGEVLHFRKHARALFDADGTFAGAIEVLIPERGARRPVERKPAADTERFHGLVSRDPQMKQVFQTIRNVAETEATVLVRGESGTGKELVARAIHDESRRRERPFVAVNCAAFTPSLLESELFGHVRGAFTGATNDRVGIFAQADGGTLFLDEVAELPMELQSKLLRVLQERTFTPVGGSRPVKVDVRVVAATHKALREEVKAGRFREDLMFRLRVVPLFLPPLRERPNDIPLLLQTFVDAANARGPRHVARIDDATMQRLQGWPWHGNVRELQNVVEYMFAIGRAPEISVECLPPEFHEGGRPAPPKATPKPPPDDEEARVREALREAGGHIGQAAEILGVSRPTLWRWRRRLGI